MNSQETVLTHHFIHKKPCSKRSHVNEYQALYLAYLIDRLGRDACEHFRVSDYSRLPTDKHKDFFKLDTYMLFTNGAYACGFVMRDAKPDNPLSESRQAPDKAIRKFDFMRLRHLVHFLLWHESWSDGNESPILNAFANRLPPTIADKLRNNQSLYLPYEETISTVFPTALAALMSVSN